MTGISDSEQHDREIQLVGTILAASQDHTRDAARNYPKSLGGAYIWDVIVETGKIATAVVVPTMGASDFSHAAESLLDAVTSGQ